MTKPFQYDNFVQSQIAMGNAGSNIQFGSGVRKNQDHPNRAFQATSGNHSRLSLKNKINELLGFCKQENEGIKTQFKHVIGAEKQILDLMKQEMDQAPRFNTYARSNVEMFPGTTQIASVVGPAQPYHGYGQQVKPRSHQTFPLNSKNYYASQTNQPQYYQQQPYQNQGFQSQGFGQPHQGYQSQQGGGYYPQGYAPQYGDQGENFGHFAQSEPYVTDYAATNPHIPQSNFGYASGHTTNDRANILKSKVLELKEQNNKLKNLASQTQIPRPDDDLEIQQLQNQVIRLRNIVQDYENQIAALSNNPAMADKVSLLRQLKDQGQRIRQDTLALLRGKVSAGSGDNARYGFDGGYQGQEPSGNYRGNFGGHFGYVSGANELISSQHKGIGGLSADQQAQFRAQLNDLRMQCEQLQQENAEIKRGNRGGNVQSSRRY